jgi:hypothetical protein
LKAIIKKKDAVNNPLSKTGILCLCCPRWAETSFQAAKLATETFLFLPTGEGTW